ncbi:pyranose dehydrogenase [Coprinopsis sp. MPI-PUGE-AT-0042]|nr:pyranose dehydrogenase [Coprinopsis sp. MPI-PUGE-AT-0042]
MAARLHILALGSLLSCLVTVPAFGAVYQDVDALLRSGTNGTFDFIVVGGGIGGSVVASRLTENPSLSVLLIEAGPDNEGALGLIVPGYAYSGDINNTLYNWNYETVPQATLNNRTLPYARGHVLGGSSSINGMVYTRGAKDDFDRWAKVTGDEGWSWNSLFPLIHKHEKWTPPPGGRNTTGQFDPLVHGYNGKVSVSLPWAEPTEFDKLRLASAETHKDEFPYNIDQSSGRPIGLTWQQSTIGDGERSSAATAYLDATVRKRKNLSIVLNTYATRVLPIPNPGGKIDIRRVEVAPRQGGARAVLTARKEVILSGGAFGTPQILLNSGIGDREDLASVGVQSVHHLPDVGKNMHDHTAVPFDMPSNMPNPPWEPYTPQPDRDFAQWQENRTGPLTETSYRLPLWSRIPADASILAEYGDPSSGPTAPHFETIVIYVNNGGLMHGFLILASQHSRGSVKIRSSDPFDPPLIDPSYFTHPFDMAAVKLGLKQTVSKFFGPPVFTDLLGPINPNPDTLSDEEFIQSVKDRTMGFGHAVSTAAMSPRGAKNGVVDPDLKVKDVAGLRVVDASVMASIYLLAERAAELILKDWY